MENFTMNQNNYPNFYTIMIKQLIIAATCISILTSPIALHAMDTYPINTSTDEENTKETDDAFDAYCAAVQAAYGPDVIDSAVPPSMAPEYSTNIYPPHLGNIAANAAKVSAYAAHAHPYPDPAYANANTDIAHAMATAYAPTIYQPYLGNFAITTNAAQAYAFATNAAQAYVYAAQTHPEQHHTFIAPASIAHEHEALSPESSRYAQLAAATPVSEIGTHAPYYPNLTHALAPTAASSVSESNGYNFYDFTTASSSTDVSSTSAASEENNNNQHSESALTHRDHLKKIADKLAVELAHELQHKPNKPKKELISESKSYKRNKTKNP